MSGHPALCWHGFGASLERSSIMMRAGILLIFALYVRTVAFDFVYDDVYILLNPPLDSWKALANVFTHDIFGLSGGSTSSYYRPFSALPVLLITKLTSGLPGWFHLFAIGIHICVICEAFVLGRLLFRDEQLAALASILFGLHPGKVESVAWIGSSMCDGLGAISFFGAFICYLKWHEIRRKAWLSFSVLCFGIALLTKETFLAAAILIPVHYWLKSQPSRRVPQAAALAGLYASVLVLYLVGRRMLLQTPADPGSIRPEVTLSGIWHAPTAFWWYVKHLVWPVRLGVMYNFNGVSGPTLRQFVLPLAGIVAGAATGCWFWYRHRSVNATFLCLWFLVTLAPYVVFSPMVRLHDRYLYLASYPFCVLIAYLILNVRRGTGDRTPVRAALALVLVAGMAAVTWHEAGYWRDEVSLWQRATQTGPGNSEPWLSLSARYSADPAQSIDVIDRGLHHRPKSPSLWQARGKVLFEQSRYSEAKIALLKVMEVSSLYDEGRFSDVRQAKAAAAFHLGLIDIRKGDYGAAETWIILASSLRPDVQEYSRTLETVRAQGREEAPAKGKH